MKEIPISFTLSKNSYRIFIEPGLLKRIPVFLQQNKWGERYAIICDRRVASLYGKKLVKTLADAGLKAQLFTFPAGEPFKTFQTAMKLISGMLRAKLNRSDAIIALGGGVTGDLAGFIASMYMRGIPYIQIPTTLLGMVDSSIGGKTGVNLTEGKNLVGTFYQPKAVYIDPDFLKTLPKKQFLNGFAEIIKCSIINDKGLFLELENMIKENKKFTSAILNKLIVQSIKIKAYIIEKDEKDIATRMVLNYGHTIGHALEKLSAYQLEHGQAISLGMILVNKIASELRLLNKKDEMRINNLINAFDLLKISPKILTKIMDPQKIWSIIQNDKKVHKSKIYFIMPKKISKTIIYPDMSKKIFLKCFLRIVND
jgi:3-dehydroquinate synthase